MSVTRIAQRYAKSLMDLAAERGKVERVHEDVLVFHNAVKVRELALFLKSPIIKADKKQGALDALFADKFDPITKGFIDIVLRKGREAYLSDVAKEFVSMYKQRKHITIVKLTTAAPVTDDFKQNVLQQLTDSTQTDTNIELTTVVDPSLIGGYTIEFGDRMYDASVARKLDLLRKEFSQNQYIKNF